MNLCIAWNKNPILSNKNDKIQVFFNVIQSRNRVLDEFCVKSKQTTNANLAQKCVIFSKALR